MKSSYGAAARAPLFGNGPGLFGGRVALRDASKEPERSDRSGQVDAYGVHVKDTFPVDPRDKHGQKQVDWIRVNRGPQASDCISIY